jgi:hypothetical protein
MKDPARGFAVRFIARIVGCVIAAVNIKLPVFAGDPRQDTGFDCAKISTKQYMSGRCNDH